MSEQKNFKKVIRREVVRRTGEEKRGRKKKSIKRTWTGRDLSEVAVGECRTAGGKKEKRSRSERQGRAEI